MLICGADKACVDAHRAKFDPLAVPHASVMLGGKRQRMSQFVRKAASLMPAKRARSVRSYAGRIMVWSSTCWHLVMPVAHAPPPTTASKSGVFVRAHYRDSRTRHHQPHACRAALRWCHGAGAPGDRVRHLHRMANPGGVVRRPRDVFERRPAIGSAAGVVKPLGRRQAGTLAARQNRDRRTGLQRAARTGQCLVRDSIADTSTAISCFASSPSLDKSRSSRESSLALLGSASLALVPVP